MASRRAAGQHRLAEERKQIAPLLAPTAPADARAAYYALAHDGRRVQLILHTLEGGQVDGFAAVCQTGRDLFVPLVILRAPVEAVEPLLQEALLSGRMYCVVAPPELRAELEQEGHRFRGHSDTEVIVEGFSAWGVVKTIERLIGMSDGIISVFFSPTLAKIQSPVVDIHAHEFVGQVHAHVPGVVHGQVVGHAAVRQGVAGGLVLVLFNVREVVF